MVLHHHSHVVIALGAAEEVGLQLRGIAKLHHRQRVFLLHQQGTAQVVYRLRILLVLGDSLAILGLGSCPFLGLERPVSLANQVAVGLCGSICRTGQQESHSYYDIMYRVHFKTFLCFCLFRAFS